MLRSYDFRCEACGKAEIRLVESEERESQVCECGSSMSRVFSKPHVRTAKTSLSYIDGQRKNTPEFQALIKQSRLEDVVNDATCPQEKMEAAKELDSITKKKGT